MKWRIFIALASLQILILQAEEPSKRANVLMPPALSMLKEEVAASATPAAPVLVTDLAVTPDPTAILPTAPAGPQTQPQTASCDETANERSKSATSDTLVLQLTQAELREKEAVIAKLSRHLESALTRLNATSCPVASGNTSLAAMAAVRAQLEQQNNILKEKQERLQLQMDELTKKSQLLDLENRQLFEALNGRPYMDRNPVKPARNDRTGRAGQVAREE